MTPLGTASETLLGAVLLLAPAVFGCVDSWSRALLGVSLYALALLCLLRGRAAPERSLPFAWAACLGIACLGLLQRLTPASPDGPWPFPASTASPTATERAMLLWGGYAALCWSALRVLRTHEAARRLLWWALGSGVFVALVGTAQNLFGAPPLYGLRYVPEGASPFGPYYNSGHAAALLGMCLPLGAALFLSKQKRLLKALSPSGPSAEPIAPLALSGAACVLLMTAIIQCESRGVLLAMAATAWLLGLAWAGELQVKALRWGGIALALALALVATTLLDSVRFSGGFGGQSLATSISQRASIYQSSLRMLRDGFPLGLGLGALPQCMAAYQDASVEAAVEHLHSDWLELAVECGIPGLLLWLSCAAAVLAAGWRTWRRARSSEMRLLTAGVLASALTFLLHALVDFPFQTPANAAFFLFLLSWLAAAPAWADKNLPRSSPSATWTRIPAAAACLVALLLCARPLAAFWALDKAAGASAEEKAVLYARASRWDPRPARYAQAVLHYLYLVEDQPEGGEPLLRLALRYCLRGLRESPLDPQLLHLGALSLWSLGRVDDAQALLERSRLVLFTGSRWHHEALQKAERDADIKLLRRMDLLPEQLAR